MSVKKTLFAELLQGNPDLPAELAKMSVAADLTILVAHSGISRGDLAKKLRWSRARVSQVLSGQDNLNIETIHTVAQAAGFAFDVAFRKPEATRARQAWEQPELIKLPAAAVELPDGRKAKAAVPRGKPAPVKKPGKTRAIKEH